MEDPRTLLEERSLGRVRESEIADVQHARPVPLTRKTTVEEAFRVTVLECLEQVSANAAAVLQREDAEGLHQMRVGMRRLHVALSGFGARSGMQSLKQLAKRSKAFTDIVAPARDLDVFLGEFIEVPASSGGQSEGFVRLRERAEQARRLAWERASSSVASVEFSVFLNDVARAAKMRLANRKSGRKTFRNAYVEPIPPLAKKFLDKSLSQVRKRGRHMRSLDERERHKLRIALKKLRYASEFFAPLYKKQQVKRYLRRIKSLLDDLGALNDVVSVRSTLSRLTNEESGKGLSPELCYAAGVLNGWHGARVDKLGRSAVRNWKKFGELDLFWR